MCRWPVLDRQHVTGRCQCHTIESGSRTGVRVHAMNSNVARQLLSSNEEYRCCALVHPVEDIEASPTNGCSFGIRGMYTAQSSVAFDGPVSNDRSSEELDSRPADEATEQVTVYTWRSSAPGLSGARRRPHWDGVLMVTASLRRSAAARYDQRPAGFACGSTARA